MNGRLRLHAFSVRVDDAEVERPAPGAAPTAFRLWKFGENTSDDGSVFFTKQSAALLMGEQAARGRVYSSDFDHLSVLTDRPATSGRASGWHRLELRADQDGNPECWAVEIEWCADAKAGLEQDPPLWRFFSPAFRHTDDGEITSYVNFALCINPLTHQLPALAAAIERQSMTKAELKALHARCMAEDCSPEERKAAMAKLGEYLEGLPDGEGERPMQEGKPHEGEKPVGEGGERAAHQAEDPLAKPGQGADAGQAPPPHDEKPKEEKLETKAALQMAADLSASNRRIDSLEIAALLEKHPDLPESVRDWLKTQSLATVKGYLQAKPKPAAPRPASATQGAEAGSVPGLQGAELEELNRAMGIRPRPQKQFERTSSGELVVHNIGPTRARQIRLAAERGQAK